MLPYFWIGSAIDYFTTDDWSCGTSNLMDMEIIFISYYEG